MDQQHGQLHPSADAQLARIDERTSILIDLVTQLQKSVDAKIDQQGTKFDTALAAIKKEFDEKLGALEESVDVKLEKVVTQDQFSPVKTITYGQVGVILLGVVGAILKLVILGAP